MEANMNKRRIFLKKAVAALLALSIVCMAACRSEAPQSQVNSIPGTTAASPSGTAPTVTEAQGSGAEETSPSSTADGSAAQTKATTTKTKATTAGTSSGAQQSNKLSSSNKLFSEPLTLTLLLGEHVNQPIKANTVKFQELQELTNVTLDIDVTPSSAYDAKLIASMASGKLYDLQKIDISQMRKYSTDLYLDVTDRMKTQVPNYYERIKNDNVFKQTSINGRYYGFCTLSAQDGDDSIGSAIWPVVRTDILEKHNLKTPTTWAECFNVMKKLKGYYPDSTPISGRYWGYIMDYMEDSLGMQRGIHYDEAQQKYVCGVLEKEYLTVLQFMKRCYDAGILDKDFGTVTSNSWNDGVLSGKIFMWIDNTGFAGSQTKALQANNPDAEMQVIPLMENLFGKKSGILYHDHWYAEQWVISAQTKEPDRVMTLMNWLYSEQGSQVCTYGKEGETYSISADNKVEIPKSVWSKYVGNSNAVYQWMSDYGLGLLCFTPLVSVQNTVTVYANNSPEDEAYGKAASDIFVKDYKAGNTHYQETLRPQVSKDIEEKYDLIKEQINATIKKFITGSKPLSEYNAFVTQIKNMDVQEVLDAMNAG